MIKVKRIFEDDWHGATSDDREFVCQGVDQATEAVARLNGVNKTLIEMIIDESAFLTVGGGNDGRYVCYVTIGDEIYNLISANQLHTKQVKIVAGGQHGFYDPDKCVSLDEVLKAVEFFVLDGQMNEDQNWERQA